MDSIYLDNNATTPLLPAVWEAMRPFFTEHPGNPASAHRAGRRARQALEDAREQTAALIDADPDEVVFTSGATEANNLAIFGLAGQPPGQLISSLIEHPSVAEPLRKLTERGFTFDLLPVDGTGVVRADALPALLRPETRLICVMLANNETGAIQPIRDQGSEVRSQKSEVRSQKSEVRSQKSEVSDSETRTRGIAPLIPDPCSLIPFHCDATQAVGRMPVRFHELGVTSLSLSAHKFHGPKGVGALLLRRGTKLDPLLWGGHQQRGRRPGTEPVALAVGLAAALELAHREHASRWETVLRLREMLLSELRATAAPVVLNGPESGGLPHTLNLSFPGCRADALLMNLDLAGICCSTGSACSSGSLLPSPVLQAMGVPADVLHSAMRFSLSHLLTEAEIEEAGRRIASVVERLRRGGGGKE